MASADSGRQATMPTFMASQPLQRHARLVAKPVAVPEADPTAMPDPNQPLPSWVSPSDKRSFQLGLNLFGKELEDILILLPQKERENMLEYFCKDYKHSATHELHRLKGCFVDSSTSLFRGARLTNLLADIGKVAALDASLMGYLGLCGLHMTIPALVAEILKFVPMKALMACTMTASVAEGIPPCSWDRLDHVLTSHKDTTHLWCNTLWPELRLRHGWTTKSSPTNGDTWYIMPADFPPVELETSLRLAAPADSITMPATPTMVNSTAAPGANTKPMTPHASATMLPRAYPIGAMPAMTSPSDCGMPLSTPATSEPASAVAAAPGAAAATASAATAASAEALLSVFQASAATPQGRVFTSIQEAMVFLKDINFPVPQTSSLACATPTDPSTPQRNEPKDRECFDKGALHNAFDAHKQQNTLQGTEFSSPVNVAESGVSVEMTGTGVVENNGSGGVRRSSLDSFLSSSDGDHGGHVNAAGSRDRHHGKNGKGEKKCDNVDCGTTSTPTWRHDHAAGLTLCNACGIFWKSYRRHRPKALIEQAAAKAAADAAAGGKLARNNVLKARKIVAPKHFDAHMDEDETAGVTSLCHLGRHAPLTATDGCDGMAGGKAATPRKLKISTAAGRLESEVDGTDTEGASHGDASDGGIWAPAVPGDQRPSRAVRTNKGRYSRWGDDFVKDDRSYAVEERKRRQSNDWMGATSPGASPTSSRRASDDAAAGNPELQALGNTLDTYTHHRGKRQGEKRKRAVQAASAAAAGAEDELGCDAGSVTDAALALLDNPPWGEEERAAVTKRLKTTSSDADTFAEIGVYVMAGLKAFSAADNTPSRGEVWQQMDAQEMQTDTPTSKAPTTSFEQLVACIAYTRGASSNSGSRSSRGGKGYRSNYRSRAMNMLGRRPSRFCPDLATKASTIDTLVHGNSTMVQGDNITVHDTGSIGVASNAGTPSNTAGSGSGLVGSHKGGIQRTPPKLTNRMKHGPSRFARQHMQAAASAEPLAASAYGPPAGLRPLRMPAGHAFAAAESADAAMRSATAAAAATVPAPFPAPMASEAMAAEAAFGKHAGQDDDTSATDMEIDPSSPNCSGTDDDMRTTCDDDEHMASDDGDDDHPEAAPVTAAIKRTSAPAPDKRCGNCNRTDKLWRRGEDGQQNLCNACGIYLKTNNCHRPVDAHGNLLKGARKVTKPRKGKKSALGPHKPSTKVAGAPATGHKGVRTSTSMQGHAPGASAVTGSAATGGNLSTPSHMNHQQSISLFHPALLNAAFAHSGSSMSTAHMGSGHVSHLTSNTSGSADGPDNHAAAVAAAQAALAAANGPPAAAAGAEGLVGVMTAEQLWQALQAATFAAAAPGAGAMDVPNGSVATLSGGLSGSTIEHAYSLGTLLNNGMHMGL